MKVTVVLYEIVMMFVGLTENLTVPFESIIALSAPTEEQFIVEFENSEYILSTPPTP